MLHNPNQASGRGAVANFHIKRDTTYTLVVVQGSEFQLSNGKSLEELIARTPTVWKSDFFTGSAPHIIRAQVPRGAKDGSYVHVVFSEPVRLASLDIGRLMALNGRPFAKCVLQSGACATSLGNAMAEEFDIAPNSPLGEFSNLSFSVSGTVSGTGRTVAEGSALVMKRAAAGIDSQGMAHVNLSLSDWSPCQSGASLCWHAHN